MACARSRPGHPRETVPTCRNGTPLLAHAVTRHPNALRPARPGKAWHAWGHGTPEVLRRVPLVGPSMAPCPALSSTKRGASPAGSPGAGRHVLRVALLGSEGRGHGEPARPPPSALTPDSGPPFFHGIFNTDPTFSDPTRLFLCRPPINFTGK